MKDDKKLTAEEKARRQKALEQFVLEQNEKNRGAAAKAGAALIKRKRMLEDL